MAAINFTWRGENAPRGSRPGKWLLFVFMGIVATGLPAYAVDREVSITAPASAVAGTKVTISVDASTDAGGGEHIGFFHGDYSTDGGSTWTAISYATDEGVTTTHAATFRVGAAGSKAIIRVRVAFRGGKAGDVDFTGKKIEWATTWNKWQMPPAKEMTILIVAP